MRLKMFVAVAAISTLAGTALVGLSSNIAAANSPSTEHVSTTGADTGNCISSPCATINYAISACARRDDHRGCDRDLRPDGRHLGADQP